MRQPFGRIVPQPDEPEPDEFLQYFDWDSFEAEQGVEATEQGVETAEQGVAA